MNKQIIVIGGLAFAAALWYFSRARTPSQPAAGASPYLGAQPKASGFVTGKQSAADAAADNNWLRSIFSDPLMGYTVPPTAPGVISPSDQVGLSMPLY